MAELKIIDLKQYETLIREKVNELNRKDKNWKWRVKSIGKKKCRIFWGYLEYMEAKEDCFILELQADEPDDQWLWARHPGGEYIDCYMVVEGKPNPRIGAEQTIESGISDAVEEIGRIARTRY